MTTQSTGADTASDYEHGWFPMAFVIVLGLAVSLPGVDWPSATGIVVLGGIYYWLMDRGLAYAQRSSVRGSIAAAFVLQLAIASGIFYLYSRAGTFSMQWLILMPLIALARMLLPILGVLAVAVAALGIAGAHLYSLSGWRAVPGFAGGMATALVFVIFFVQVAMRENAARAESERLSAELADANRRLAAYAVEVEELATTRERTRVAREIHDSLGHVLTAINVQIEAAQAIVGRDPDKAAEAVRAAQTLAQEGLQEVRRSVATLRSSPLENRSLDQALKELTEHSIGAGTPTDFEVFGPPRQLSPQAELTLFRSAQEGLTNVRKHASARHASLVLDYGDTSTVRLIVEDDGKGSQDPSGGFGLEGVRERVRQLEGSLRIASGDGGGMKLEIEVPG